MMLFSFLVQLYTVLKLNFGYLINCSSDMIIEEEALERKCNMDNNHTQEDKQALIGHKRKRDDDRPENKDSQCSPWAHKLPRNMIEEILERLPLINYGTFLAVCHPWKEIAMQLYLQPYLVNLPYNRWLCDPWMINVKNGKSMQIRHPFFDERFCVGASHGWFILKKKKSCNVCVMNLFNGARFQLPKWNPRLFSGSIFLSSSPVSGNCTVLVIGMYVSGFAFCKIGDSTWSIEKHLFHPNSSDEGVVEYLDQAVTLGGRFYVLTSFGRLLAIDNVHDRPPTMTIIGENKVVPKREVFRYYTYLMESEGQILLVFLCIPGIVRTMNHVEVFKFDFESAAWDQIEKLDGRTLFVGFNCSFSVRSYKDYVYFVDNSSDGWIIYDMEKKKVSLIQYFDWRSPSAIRDRIWVLPTLEYPANM